MNQLHDDDGLAHARAAKQSDLSALQIGLDQVHDFHACLKHFEIRGLFVESRRRTMNWIVQFGFHRPEPVYRLAEHVQHAPKRRASNGNLNRVALIDGLHAAHDAFRRLQRHGTHAALAEMLLDLDDNIDRRSRLKSFARHAHGVVNRRQLVLFELNVEHRPDHLHHVTGCPNRSFCLCHPWSPRPVRFDY